MKQAPFQLIAGLILPLLLAGCATQETHPVAIEKIEKGTAGEQPEKVAASKVKYPPVKLTPELLYQLLSAEVAGQRGQIGYAMKNYLLAAKETGDPRLAERATRIALFAQNINYATQAAKLWVKTAPNSGDAQQVLVSLLLGQQQYDKAEDHLKQLVALSPESREQTFLMVATLLAGSANSEAALALMGKLPAVKANDPDALYGYAYLALRLSQLDIALQTVDQVIAQRPKADKPIIMRSRILQQQGKEEAALESLKTAVNQREASFPLRLAYGQLLIETHHISKAQALFKQLEQEQPENPDVLMAQGILATERLEYKQAESYFQRLLKVNERAAQARFYLGRLAELQGDPEKAIGWYASITKGELVIDARIRQAVLMARQGNVQDARQYLQLLGHKFPHQVEHFQLAEGEILVDAGRYQEAMAHYNKALKDKPNNTDLLYARALAAEKLDRLDIVERDLHQVLKLEPNNAEALNALGYTLASRTKRFQEALRYVSKAVALKPNNAFILDSMGWVYYRLGDYGKAEEYLLRAMRIRKDPEIAAHLGEVLWMKGNKAEACKIWQRSLKKNQGNKALLEVMQRFQK